MKFQAALFDMDGTLINSEPYWLVAERALMSRFGHTWTDLEQAHCIGGPLPKVGAYMSELANHAEDPLYFEVELVRMVAEQFKKGLEFMPGARELVDALVQAQVPMALVSASPRLLVDSALELLPEGTFITSVSSQDVSVSKPHPESYLKAADHLEVDITQCVVLEDSKTGIDAGLASGAFVIGIPYIIEYPPHPRLHIRKSLHDLSLTQMDELFLSSNSEIEVL